MLTAPVTHNALPGKVTSAHHQNFPRGVAMWRRMPYSSGFIYARMYHLGLVNPKRVGFAQRVHRALTCSPAPCVFPNTDASGGSAPVNETPIAANPNNALQLTTAANDYNCPNIQGSYSTTDGGTTWNRSCMTSAPGYSFGDGDPVVGYDLNGNAFRGGIDGGSSGYTIAVAKSTDGGVTWGTPVAAQKNFFSGGLTDKPWMQVDDSPTSAWPNRIYLIVNQFDSASNTTEMVNYSDNAGATWTTPVPVGPKATFPTVNQFPDLAIAANGTVYATWMTCTANGSTGDCGGTVATMNITSSLDGGNTWSSPVTIDSPTLAPDTCGAFYGCLPNTSERVSDIPVTAVDNGTNANRNGRVRSCDYTWTGSPLHMMVQCRNSRDGGNTWTGAHPVAPASDTHDQFFPWMSISPTSTMGVTWMDRRNDPSNINYEEFAGIPIVGTTTFLNFQVAANPSNPFNDGFGSGFMGDYSGDVWAGTSLYASWTDTTVGIANDFVGGVLSTR
jgi:hypothetical protein